MDYASIAAALAKDIDPNPVAMVEDFKADLRVRGLSGPITRSDFILRAASRVDL